MGRTRTRTAAGLGLDADALIALDRGDKRIIALLGRALRPIIGDQGLLSSGST